MTDLIYFEYQLIVGFIGCKCLCHLHDYSKLVIFLVIRSYFFSTVNLNLSKLWEIVEDRGAWRATVHGVPKTRDLVTEQ